jgi:4-hydroxybenzoate polyprenyltransferase
MVFAMAVAEQTAATPARSKLSALWAVARPYQWVKNGIVVAPLIFGQKLFDVRDFALTVLAVVAFCTISSTGYIINDIADRETDRRHPEKRNRPLASGELTVSEASRLAAGLAIVSLVMSVLLGPAFLLVAVFYVAMQLSYSLFLKRLVIVDVVAIAIGFVLRAFAGGAAIHVEVSPWLVFITFVLALLLALARRRHELIVLGPGASAHRDTLDHYSVRLIDQMISIVAGATLVGYMIYTASPDVERKLHAPYLYVTVPFVVIGILRYLYLIHERQEGGDPARLLLKDRMLLLSVLLWIAADIVLLYF